MIKNNYKKKIISVIKTLFDTKSGCFFEKNFTNLLCKE